ncbi:MAG: DUF1934 domain-containing protein [Acutalibacteraceae bacterium]|nr:DUF1934 domain-containing protein [Acutalibacteraceae bacterium]
MIKDVIIEIKTEQTLDDSTDKIEFTTDARYGFRDGSYFISYDESKLMEVEGEIKTTLYVKPNASVVLQRKGAYNSRMVIEKGVRNNCLYATPNGEFSLGIFGEKVLANLSDDGGNITMNYTIDSGLQLLSRNKVNISIREVN